MKIASLKVEVEGQSKISSEAVADRIELQEGDTADIAALQREAGIRVRHGRF